MPVGHIPVTGSPSRGDDGRPVIPARIIGNQSQEGGLCFN